MGRPSPSKLVAVRAGGRYGFVSRGGRSTCGQRFPRFDYRKVFFWDTLVPKSVKNINPRLNNDASGKCYRFW